MLRGEESRGQRPGGQRGAEGRNKLKRRTSENSLRWQHYELHNSTTEHSEKCNEPRRSFLFFSFFFVFVFQGADLCCVIVACRERIGWFRFRGKQRKTIFKKNGPKKLIVGKQNNWKWWEKIIMWEQVIVTASLNHRLRVCFRNEWGIKNTRPCGGTWLPLSFTKISVLH